MAETNTFGGKIKNFNKSKNEAYLQSLLIVNFNYELFDGKKELPGIY